MLSVTSLFPIPGSRKKFHRVGRGISAGQGKTCGRGMRGQKSRKGEGAGVRHGFEGGQTALYRRLPKINKPQKGHEKTVYELIKISELNQVEAGSEVDYDKLFSEGITTKANKGRSIFKVVGSEESLNVKNLVVRAHAFSASAREAIESNGGKCIVLSPTFAGTLEEAEANKSALKVAQLAKLKEFRALKAKRATSKI